jgi:tRNA pseudouridine38-40 synthase
MIEIEVRGEAFLYNMVRIIAGTILEAGMGRIPADSVGDIIESRERKRAGRTLPACGLTLEEVLFDEANARLR